MRSGRALAFLRAGQVAGLVHTVVHREASTDLCRCLFPLLDDRELRAFGVDPMNESPRLTRNRIWSLLRPRL